MDIDDIRSMIRAAIKAQVSKAVKQRRRLPENFSEFNSLLREVVSESDVDHNTIYEMWENLSSEMKGIDSNLHRINEWNESLKYYVLRADLTIEAKHAILRQLTRK